MKKAILAIFVAAVVAFLAYAGFRERHLVYLFSPGSRASAVSACDESLWNYNAETENVLNPCLTITGVVQSRQAETDGDENIQVRPDQQYVHLINIWNILGQWGNIAVEPICEHRPVKKPFIKACQGYTSRLTLPPVGAHISITGSYGTDKHRWTEIHPVTNITVIP